MIEKFLSRFFFFYFGVDRSFAIWNLGQPFIPLLRFDRIRRNSSRCNHAHKDN